MAILTRVLSREQDMKQFAMAIQWVLTPPHVAGLLIQKITRSGSQMVGPGNLTKDRTIYWEAWVVLGSSVYGADISTKQPQAIPTHVSHDVFAGPAKGFGGTRFEGEVYWIDQASPDYQTVLGRMPIGGVPDAASLWSTYADPFAGATPPSLMSRDEFFLNEAF